MVNYIILGVIAIIAIFLITITIAKYQTPKFVPVKIGNVTVNAEVADTQPKQMRGLMFREELPAKDGMLFVFEREGRHGIWMMNTSIDLDIIWLDKDKKIIHIEKKAQPCEALVICPSYRPQTNAKYVLEVNGGFTGTHRIKVGQVAKFNLNKLF